jgi:hypothetical protein
MQSGWELGSVTSVNGGAAVALVALIACLTIGPFGLALWRFLVHRGRAFRAETAEKEPHSPIPGPALLHGTVETDDGGPAIRIEIDQTGEEWSNKGNWSHRWTEKNRRVSARRFRLRLSGDDTVVMVDPDERVHLIDTLDTENVEHRYRLRVAELSDKEKVWISGVLMEEGRRAGAGSAYRSGPGALVLCGTLTEPLDIASGALGSQFTHWRRYYGNAWRVLGLAVFAVHFLMLAPFYALFWTGKPTMCDFASTSNYITTNKGHSTTHFVLQARLPAEMGGGLVKDEVSYAVFQAANRHELPRVPFVVASVAPWLHSIGESADVNVVALILSFLVGLACSIGLPVSRFYAKPWYEQRKVVEGGSGRLESGAYVPAVPG